MNKTTRSLIRTALILVSLVALAGCVTTEYVIGGASGIDGDVGRPYEILGYVSTEIVQREVITSGLMDSGTAEFSFNGFRRNLLDAARTTHSNVDDVIRVVVTPTQRISTTNLFFLSSSSFEGGVYHVEGLAIRYTD